MTHQMMTVIAIGSVLGLAACNAGEEAAPETGMTPAETAPAAQAQPADRPAEDAPAEETAPSDPPVEAAPEEAQSAGGYADCPAVDFEMERHADCRLALEDGGVLQFDFGPREVFPYPMQVRHLGPDGQLVQGFDHHVGSPKLYPALEDVDGDSFADLTIPYGGGMVNEEWGVWLRSGEGFAEAGSLIWASRSVNEDGFIITSTRDSAVAWYDDYTRVVDGRFRTYFHLRRNLANETCSATDVEGGFAALGLTIEEIEARYCTSAERAE